MKPFNLDEYLKNPSKKVVTRDCKEVRIICTDRLDEDYPIIALVKVLTNVEWCESFTADGRNSKVRKESDFDLFFAPEKKEGWINIWDGDDGTRCVGAEIFESFEDAKNRDIIDRIAKIKIEWEE